MIRLAKSALIVAVLGAVSMGCSYGVPAVSGDKVVLPRQDNFLFGALRTVYVCKITDSGLASCVEGESP